MLDANLRRYRSLVNIAQPSDAFQPRLQRGQSRLSAPFLEEPENRIEGQESRDDRCLDVLAEDIL